MPQGWTLGGTSRTAEGRAAIAADGVIALSSDQTEGFEAGAVVIAAPPTADGCPGLAALRRERGWLGYLSTTGVYGDLGGGWAFEETPPNPQSIEATRRAQAEAGWLARGAQVFRLPGIYGAGRSALEKVASPSARSLVKPGQVFSRIHVDDLAAGLLASMARPRPGAIYNLCDDEPCETPLVDAHAAALLGLAPPPRIAMEDATLSPTQLRFYAECKRVSNARAKAELGWRPRFPTFREGLQAIMDASLSGSSAAPEPNPPPCLPAFRPGR